MLQTIGSRQLSRGEAGGDRNYVHAIKSIAPEDGEETVRLDLELTRGAVIRGEVTDEHGEPVDEMIMVSRLNVFPGQLTWRGDTVPIRGGRFEISGIQVGDTVPVHFLDARRRLGATLMATAADPQPKVVLRPCGQARMRFVSENGDPVADYEPWIEIVATPGRLGEFQLARRMGALAPDTDFIANVDNLNHRHVSDGRRKSDKDGHFLLPALIPGAMYRVQTAANILGQKWKTFVAQADETIELGDLSVDASSD